MHGIKPGLIEEMCLEALVIHSSFSMPVTYILRLYV